MVMARGHGTPRRHNDWTLKITVVACCVALFFLSPGFSRMLPADSKANLRRSGVLERSAMVHEGARSETRGRILNEVPEIGGGRNGTEDDLTSDYSFPTHNDNGEDGSPSSPASKASTRSKTSQRFSRYTAQYGHRYPRGV